MDDPASALTRAEPLPTLPSLEEAQARLAAGLPPAFASFAADLLAHPDPDEPSHFGRDVLQPETEAVTEAAFIGHQTAQGR